MTRRMLCLLMVALTAAVSAETVTLTRESTVRLALERNETYRSTQLEEDRVRGQYLEARAGAFPHLKFQGSYLRNIDLSTSVLSITNDAGVTETSTLTFGTPHNYSFGFTLTQPLYAAGKVGTAIKIAKYGFEYTSQKIRESRNNIATNADKAYLDAIAARDAEHVFREAERLADSNLAVVERLYDQGQVSEYDLLRAQVQAANVKPDRIAAANNARLALDQLRLLLALSPEDDIVLSEAIDEVSVPTLDSDSLIAMALENRPELGQSEQLVKINKKLIDIERGGYKPNVSLSSNVQWESYANRFKATTIDSDSWYRSWNVGLMLTWDIFSGFETTGRVRQAKVDYSQSRLKNSQLERSIRLEVRNALGNVEESKERVLALGETETRAQRGMEIARVRFTSGIGTQLEVLDAQVALTTARVNKITAQHDLAAAISALRRAVGLDWAVQW